MGCKKITEYLFTLFTFVAAFCGRFKKMKMKKN